MCSVFFSFFPCMFFPLFNLCASSVLVPALPRGVLPTCRSTFSVRSQLYSQSTQLSHTNVLKQEKKSSQVLQNAATGELVMPTKICFVEFFSFEHTYFLLGPWIQFWRLWSKKKNKWEYIYIYINWYWSLFYKKMIILGYFTKWRAGSMVQHHLPQVSWK